MRHTVALALATAVAGLTCVAQKPGIENLVNVSWGDQIMVATGDAQLDMPEKIQRAVASWQQEHDIATVLWRASSYYIQDFYVHRVSGDFIRRYYDKVREIQSRFEPLPEARRAARDRGMAFLLYMTIYDHGAPEDVLYAGTTPFPWQDRAVIEHPEWQTVDLHGTPHWGVLEMAYPEARKLMVTRTTGYVERFESDGVYICTRTHSLPALHADQFGFSPPIVAEYRRRYDIDILHDPRFDREADGYLPDSDVVENWRRLRGEYLVQFYRELRAALPGKTIYTGIPRGHYLGPPYGNLCLDWESLVRDRLVDGIVLGPHAGKGLHPPLYVPHETIGYRCSEDDSIAIPSRRECMDLYGALCAQSGVKLFLQGCRGESERRLARESDRLKGFMLHTPSSRGTARIIWPPDQQFGTRSVSVEAMVFSAEDADAYKGRWPRIMSRYDHEDNPRSRGWEWILLPDGKFRFRVNFAGADEADTSEIALDSAEPFPTGRWVHVATSIDRAAGKVRILMDGVVAGEAVCPDLPVRSTPDLDLWLGRYGGSNCHSFVGSIDELCIRVGSPVQVRQPGVPLRPTPDTVVLVHFDEPDEDGAFPASPADVVVRPVGSADLRDGPAGLGRALALGW